MGSSRWGTFRHSAGLALLIAIALLATGCHRGYYRVQADRDAYALVRQKSNHPHWDLKNYSINMDPRSRMAAVGNPDCPEMPPDDPSAHELMHCVDNKRGYPDWHCAGDTPYVESPLWAQYLNVDEHGSLVLTADDSIRVGLVHSREYQQQLEELYLSALDVSFERFRFDSQFFAGYSAFYTADGKDRAGGGGNSSSVLNLSTFSNGPRQIAMQRSFTTGATLVVGLANQLVWQFSGPDNYQGNTLLDFALVQPLLRNAGRDRVMERLTVSERVLLGNVRAMEQYRQEFYVSLMTGRNVGQGPSRRGGVFGAGLEGFTGVAGGFGRVNAGGASVAGGNSAGAGNVGGYLGLLQTQQGIRNLEDNVVRLRSNLFRLDQFLVELKQRSSEEGLVNNILRQDLQVAQARQALYNAESQLLNSRNAYETTVDQYKITLGLPPDICVDIQDDILKPFQLVDINAQAEATRLNKLNDDFGRARLRVTSNFQTELLDDPTSPTGKSEVRRLKWYPELAKDLQSLHDILESMREIRGELIEKYLPEARKDLASAKAAREHRRERLKELRAQIIEVQKNPCALLPVPDINEEIFDLQTREALFDDLADNLEEVADKIDLAYVDHLDQRQKNILTAIDRGEQLSERELAELVYERVLFPKQRAADRGAAPAQPMERLSRPTVRDIVVEFPSDLLVMQLVQAVARAESIELEPVSLEVDRAIAIARKYRRDLMNARASLVDSWRLIRFNADQLESSVNILFSGDIANTGQNPLQLRDTTGRLRVGMQFDAPLTRLSERNTYRQSLIEYQQARRSFYAFEDQVYRVLRSELRTLFANELNFELQRLAVLQAALQVDRNEDIRIDQELTNQASGATAARDSVSALSDLLNAQNNFLSIWVNYEAQRQSLDLDLGTMRLDCEGIWVDPGKIGKDYGSHDPWEEDWDAALHDPDFANLDEDAEEVPAGQRRELSGDMGTDEGMGMTPMESDNENDMELIPAPMPPDRLPEPDALPMQPGEVPMNDLPELLPAENQPELFPPNNTTTQSPMTPHWQAHAVSYVEPQERFPVRQIKSEVPASKVRTSPANRTAIRVVSPTQAGGNSLKR